MRPVGHDEDEKETFQAWWQRWDGRLANLEPRIAEQWIYRHWCRSYMAFLELKPITWSEEVWSGDQILANVHMEFGGPMDPIWDFDQFNGARGLGPISTARAMNTGTWDMPLLVLKTPNGLHSAEGELHEVRFVVAEGSKRMRYLNALRHRGEGAGPHALLVLSTPQAR